MQEKWNHAPTPRFHINVPSNGIQNSQKVETTQITTTCLRDEHNVAYPYDGNLFSNFFKHKADTCYNMMTLENTRPATDLMLYDSIYVKCPQ